MPEPPPSVPRLLAPPVAPARYRVYYRTSHMATERNAGEVWCLDGDQIPVDMSEYVTILRVEPARPGDAR